MAFVAVLDLVRRRKDGDQLPETVELLELNQAKLRAALEQFPSLEPTTAGIDPVDIVEEELNEQEVLRSNNGLAEELSLVRDYLEERNEPITLEARPDDI
ncbi:hypothetical protein SAMN05216559_4171 [Halomicrobium zhouii]|uniref:Uncharacterized protein n=1 Tax=Halomicrobium zhouii TaxID=767519 RepID=A0A1I6MB92_9EURY|nr:hypothetical protein [Halomicrobium zhouii]SFS12974.1 hypothetical protein SAMN05216559_4171 [Halomicrobium zhouii]